MAFKELRGNTLGQMVQWNTLGQTVRGRYVSKKPGKTFNGRQSWIAILRGDSGVDIAVPQTTVLEDRFNETPIGADVQITFTAYGKGQGGPQSTKLFKFEVDDSVVGQPTPAAVASTPAVATTPNVQPQAPVAAPPLKPVAEYEELLRKTNPSGAEAIINALKSLYPDPSVYVTKLRDTLAQQGAAV
jgi:hypothetical protein